MPRYPIPAITANIYDIDFDARGQIYVASDDGSITVYDGDLKPLSRAQLTNAGLPGSIAIAPGGKSLAIGYRSIAAIEIVSLPGFQPLFTLDTGFVTRGSLGFVSWSADSETLYAGGTYFERDIDPFLIFAWNDRGRGQRRLIGTTMGNVLDLDPFPGGGVAMASALPSWGVLDGASLFHGPVSANMTEKLGNDFQVSRDGGQVWFGLGVRSVDPWLFDARTLTFEAVPQPPAGFVSPEIATLPILDWEDTQSPSLAGTPIGLMPGDTAHSLAIAPDARSFVLGTSWNLQRFDKGGGLLWTAIAPAQCWGVNYSGDGAIVVAAFGDGTLHWYDAGTGEELLALFVHVPSKRWIAWTPSGYYAASPGAEDFIGWHVNGKDWASTPEFYPASRFRQRYYRPDVVQLVLETRSEEKALEKANTAAGRKQEAQSIDEQLPASVELLANTREIETSKTDISLPYRLFSPTGRPVSRVEARIDGRPVASRGVSQDESEFPLGEDLEITVSVPPRDSELSLIAFIGDQPGVAVTIPIKWQGTAAGKKKHNLHALLVGVSAYGDETMRLKYAAKDAADLAAALKAQEGQFYEKTEIVTLLDGEADKSAVEKQLLLLRKKTGPDDTALVFLAGHGMTDKAMDFYYLAADAEMDADMLEATAVDGRLIRKALAAIPGRVVLMMDTCRSGAGIEGAVDMSRTANDMAQDTAGIVMFASSQGREDSLESSTWENGAFTEALLSILGDANIYGGDGRLSIPELEEAITVRVAELTEGRQNAGMTKYGSIPRFFIAGLPGH